MSDDMKKSVFNVNICDAKSKMNVMKAAAGIPGIDSLSFDLEKKQMTVVGTVDPAKVVGKLKKKFNPIITTVGQYKKEGGTNNNQAQGRVNDRIEPPYWGPWAYPHLYHHYPHWYHHPAEEGPSGCVIS